MRSMKDQSAAWEQLDGCPAYAGGKRTTSPRGRARKDRSRFTSARRPGYSSSAASTSTSTPASGMITRAGTSSPERQAATALRFDSPLTRNATCRERLSRDALRDTRCGGRLGELNIDRTSGE